MSRKDDLDEVIQRHLDDEVWMTADSIATKVTFRDGLRTDATEVGGRLRSLRHRGLVENRLHEHGYYYEWRKPNRQEEPDG